MPTDPTPPAASAGEALLPRIAQAVGSLNAVAYGDDMPAASRDVLLLAASVLRACRIEIERRAQPAAGAACPTCEGRGLAVATEEGVGCPGCGKRPAAEAVGEVEDDSEMDGTDDAHPAWWRGHADGVAGACRVMEAALDGDVAGLCHEPLEGLRKRIAALRARVGGGGR